MCFPVSKKFPEAYRGCIWVQHWSSWNMNIYRYFSKSIHRWLFSFICLCIFGFCPNICLPPTIALDLLWSTQNRWLHGIRYTERLMRLVEARFPGGAPLWPGSAVFICFLFPRNPSARLTSEGKKINGTARHKSTGMEWVFLCREGANPFEGKNHRVNEIFQTYPAVLWGPGSPVCFCGSFPQLKYHLWVKKKKNLYNKDNEW